MDKIDLNKSEKNSMPYLSIIVPVFNKVKYLNFCIESILAQSFKEFELILINDGSTDGSGLKCDNYKSLDPRIIVIHQENKGVSKARNVGIACSKGKYIGFVDSDDTIENDMYEILIRNAINTDSDISICSIKRTYKKNTTKMLNDNRLEIFNKDQGLSGVVKNLFDMSANNKVFRSGLVKNIEFEGRFKEDLLFNIVAFSKANKCVFQNTSKYNYILRNNSVSVEKLSEKDMEGLAVDEKIMSIVSDKCNSIIEEAQVNFFVQNISILNLILLSSKTKYAKEFEIITNNLKKYSFLISKSQILRKKHRFAYCIFRISPLLYTSFLRFYILIIPSEAGKREK